MRLLALEILRRHLRVSFGRGENKRTPTDLWQIKRHRRGAVSRSRLGFRCALREIRSRLTEICYTSPYTFLYLHYVLHPPFPAVLYAQSAPDSPTMGPFRREAVLELQLALPLCSVESGERVRDCLVISLVSVCGLSLLSIYGLTQYLHSGPACAVWTHTLRITSNYMLAMLPRDGPRRHRPRDSVCVTVSARREGSASRYSFTPHPAQHPSSQH